MTSKFSKLYISPYTLEFKSSASFSPLNKTRFVEGALLAFEFEKTSIGYSDFLPWPVFGEENLASQLDKIKQGTLSKRFLIAMHNALLDAKARSQKRSVFFNLKIPDSHFLIEDLLNFSKEDLIMEKGFKAVKVKLIPSQISRQIDKLKFLYSHFKNIKWRFDLNGQSWTIWKSKLEFFKKDMDFIEDPLNDTKIKTEEKALFAQDWIPNSRLQIKIVKPSRDSLLSLIKGLSLSQWKRLVFTHSFDHPLGQSSSAFWAGIFYKIYPCFFETGNFNQSPFLKINSYPFYKEGPAFVPPSGFGFGFGESLKKEQWKRWL